MRAPIEILGDSYADDVSAFSAQETINLVPERAERGGTRTLTKMTRRAGLATFGTAGTGTLRGARRFKGVLYVVADTMLYSVAADGTATALGTITGSGRVSLTNNETQLAISNMTGEGATSGWTYTPGTATFAQIASANFPGGVLTYLDGYVIGTVPGTSDYGISALDDATSWSALDRKTCESATDGLLAVVADHGELLCLGESSIEVHHNTGSLTFPLERLTTIERGIASEFAWGQTDNGFFFLGDDGIMYRLNQWTPVRISTRPVEQWVEGETRSEAFSMAYSRKGHSFVFLSFPNGKTYCFDTSTGLWARWRSFGMERWRANCYVNAYGKHLVGDMTNGTIWELSETTYTEGSQPLVAERTTQYVNANGEWVSMEEFEPLVDAGVGLTSGQGSDPVLLLSYSDDGGRTWSNPREGNIGRRGEYTNRVRYHGLGAFNQSRAMRLHYSEPTPFTLFGAMADMT